MAADRSPAHRLDANGTETRLQHNPTPRIVQIRPGLGPTDQLPRPVGCDAVPFPFVIVYSRCQEGTPFIRGTADGDNFREIDSRAGDEVEIVGPFRHSQCFANQHTCPSGIASAC